MDQESIVAACRKHYAPNKDDCSGFVRAVAAEFGYTLKGNADQIIGALEKSWMNLDRSKAIEAVKEGALVIAGLQAGAHTPPRNHGHVVVIIEGELYNEKYPLVWCGSIGSAQSNGTKSVGEIWRKIDRDAVLYYQAPDK